MNRMLLFCADWMRRAFCGIYYYEKEAKGVKMEEKKVKLPYFMSYPVLGEKMQSEEEISDRDYFRQMYPVSVKRYLRVIRDVLDRMDADESYIYDEYPDKIRMERLAQIVLRKVSLEKHMDRETQKNLIKVLLWEEVIYRRKQKRDKNLLP